MIGKTILHYNILSKLGEGGMGVVYKAEDTKLKREVAIKFLPRQIAASEAERERFRIEAQAAAALNHPNIGTIYAIEDMVSDDTEPGETFIVMELIEGQELKEKIGGNPLSVSEAHNIAIQVVTGMQAAHEKGVIHRDIKSANVMITENGNVKIMDFGLAKVGNAANLTKSGTTLGTVVYMSPEQARGEKVDQRADIWSVGVLLYEMLAGHHPFQGDYDQAIIYTILNEEATPVTEISQDIPEDLGKIVAKALSKDVDDRFQTMSEFLDDLLFLKGKPTSWETQPAKSLQRKTRMNSRPILMVSVFFAIMAMTLGYFFLFSSPETVITIGQTKQLSRDTGLEIDPAVSPDGKMIAYASGPVTQMNIFIRQIAGGNSIELTQNLPGHHRWPQWSPDGTKISFLSTVAEQATINVVPAFGGVLTGLAEANASPLNSSPGIATGSPIWSPDGSSIAYVQGDDILVQPIDGGAPRKITTAFLPHSLSWSPDAKQLAYVSGNHEFIFGTITFANMAPSSIWVIGTNGGEPVQITKSDAINVSPIWLPQKGNLLFVSNADGSRDIYQVTLDDEGLPKTNPRRITTGLNAHTISVTPDGKKLAYSLFTFTSNIWAIDIPKSGQISIAEAKQITTGNQVIETPAVSANGRWLAFDSDRNGDGDIFKMPVSGGNEQQLTTHPSGDWTPSWGPNEKEITFHSFRNGNRDVYAIGADGKSLQRVTSDPAQERYQDWSPQGNQIVFHSDKTGAVELYVATRDEQQRTWTTGKQLTSEGGLYPRWSPDGSAIVYMSIADRSLRLISPGGGESKILFRCEDPETQPIPAFADWSPDSRTIYFRSHDLKNQASFWSIPASGGTPRLLISFDDPTMSSNRSEFSTDGRRFFFTIGNRESDIWVMDVKAEQ